MRIERLFMSNSACAWNDRSKADDRGKRRRMRAFAYSLRGETFVSSPLPLKNNRH